MKTMTITKTSARAVLLVAWLLLPQAAHCFYNPSTGKWLSRDPVGEQGGLSLSCFVGNNPTAAYDNLGLAAGGPAYTIVNLSPPTGWWGVALGDVDSGSTTYLGFRSRYLPSDGRYGHPACPCKKEDIVLVQAVRDALGYPIHIDDGDPKQPPPHNVGDPIHEYYWNGRPPEGPLTIVDRPNTSYNGGTWEFEDCAVCRTHPKPGFTLDQVMGCVKFRFKRINLNTAELTVHTAGGDFSGRVVFAAAESPGKLWSKALQNW